MIEAIRKGLDDPGPLIANAERAKAFTLQSCNEHVTIDYFGRVLDEFEADNRFAK